MNWPSACATGFETPAASRLLLNTLRAIPELVWASLLLIAAGLGPFPGTLALALHTTGEANAMFVREADETVLIAGERPYLDHRELERALRASDADAACRSIA